MGEKLPPATTTKKAHSQQLTAFDEIPQGGKSEHGGGKKTQSLPPILPGARGSPSPAWVSPTTELCLDRNRRSAHRIGIQ